MAEESQALARFYQGYAQDGMSEDGLPRYRDVLMIKLAVPPYTQLEREATDEDIETYPGPWKLYEKEQATRKQLPETDGYPLALWPVVSPAELNMLAARDIYTVEQLAKLTARGANTAGIPGELKQLAERAKAMMEMSKDIGQFETIIRDKDGQLAVLKEQVDELRGTIKAQDGLINTLKLKVA
jgi:hypothetical protein